VVNYLGKARNRIRYYWRLFILKDPYYVAHRAWVKVSGDRTLRQEYPLGPNSVVIDVGGYLGEWAMLIAEEFDSEIHIFEAVPQFADKIREAFLQNGKCKVYSCGLADADGQDCFSLDDNGSSRFHGKKAIQVSFRDVDAVFREIGIEHIDLIKINIEGGEFPLLWKLLETGWIQRCDYLQIQFHEFAPDAHAQREKLRHKISETHEEMWNYYFVWESWKRKELP